VTARVDFKIRPTYDPKRFSTSRYRQKFPRQKLKVALEELRQHRFGGDRDHGTGQREYIARNLSEAGYIFLAKIPLLTVIGQPGSARWVFCNKDGVAGRAAVEYESGGRVVATEFSAAMRQLRREAEQALGRPSHSGAGLGAGYRGKNPAGASGKNGNSRSIEKQFDSDFEQQFAAAMQDGSEEPEVALRQCGADNFAPPSTYPTVANAARQQ